MRFQVWTNLATAASRLPDQMMHWLWVFQGHSRLTWQFLMRHLFWLCLISREEDFPLSSFPSTAYKLLPGGLCYQFDFLQRPWFPHLTPSLVFFWCSWLPHQRLFEQFRYRLHWWILFFRQLTKNQTIDLNFDFIGYHWEELWSVKSRRNRLRAKVPSNKSLICKKLKINCDEQKYTLANLDLFLT